MIALTLLAAAALIHAPGDSLHGTVRVAGAGEGIPGVQVSVRGHVEVVLTDFAGRYVLHNLRGDRLALRFERLGFQPLTVDVMVGDGGGAGVDVDLAPAAVALAPVAVLPFDSPAPPPLTDSVEIGRVALTQTSARRNPLVGEADVFAALAAAPFVNGGEELAPSLRVRGGSGDENLILLDGLPWRGPRPPAGTLGMLPSSAVTAVDVHTAVPPARYGGALSSTIVLQPQIGGHRSAEGSVDPTMVEQAVGTPLGGALRGATLFLSGRRTYRSVWSQADQTGESANGFDDVFGHLSLPAPRGRFDFYYVGSNHQLAFPAQAEMAEADSAAPGSPQNAFAATGSLGGLVWTDSLGEARRAQARVWYSEVTGESVWGALSAASSLRDIGASAEYASGQTEAGLSISRIATAYQVQHASSPTLVLNAAPVVAAVFAAQRWTPAQSWTLSTGVRLSATPTWGLYVEPRVWTRVALWPRASVSLGYARLHQYVQSARNEESVVDALIGADFPIAAGSGGLPPARSDQLTGTISTRLGARTTIQLDGYTRWLSGLALTPLATQHPFADVVVPVGRGSVWGGDAILTYPADRLDLRVQVGLLGSYRTAGAMRYRTGDARGRLAVGLGYQLPNSMAVRLALWAGAGRATTFLQDGMQLESAGLRGTGELAGTPEALAGIPNGAQLPGYARVDLGLSKSWWRPRGGDGAPRISTSLTVANLFNRRNALAFVAAPDGQQPVFLLSRTLSLRVRWYLAR